AALMTLRIRIEARRERTLGEQHLALEPGHGLFDPTAEQGVAGSEKSIGQKLDELRIVVEHLFKVGDEPALVGRIAGKAAAKMIVDAALRNGPERQEDAVAIARVAGPE